MYFYGYRQHQPHAFVNKLNFKKKHKKNFKWVSIYRLLIVFFFFNRRILLHGKNSQKRDNIKKR